MASEVPASLPASHPLSLQVQDAPSHGSVGRAATAKGPRAHRHSRPEVEGGQAIQVISPSEGLAVSNMRAVPLWGGGLRNLLGGAILLWHIFGIPGWPLPCPGLARPLPVEVKCRPGAKGPALSRGGGELC